MPLLPAACQCPCAASIYSGGAAPAEFTYTIARWAQKASPVWGSIYDQRKIPLHYFAIGSKKPEINLQITGSADYWFLVSMVKIVCGGK
jgi:hypothetical protein